MRVFICTAGTRGLCRCATRLMPEAQNAAFSSAPCIWLAKSGENTPETVETLTPNFLEHLAAHHAHDAAAAAPDGSRRFVRNPPACGIAGVEPESSIASNSAQIRSRRAANQVTTAGYKASWATALSWPFMSACYQLLFRPAPRRERVVLSQLTASAEVAALRHRFERAEQRAERLAGREHRKRTWAPHLAASTRSALEIFRASGHALLRINRVNRSRQRVKMAGSGSIGTGRSREAHVRSPRRIQARLPENPYDVDRRRRRWRHRLAVYRRPEPDPPIAQACRTARSSMSAASPRTPPCASSGSASPIYIRKLNAKQIADNQFVVASISCRTRPDYTDAREAGLRDLRCCGRPEHRHRLRAGGQ